VEKAQLHYLLLNILLLLAVVLAVVTMVAAVERGAYFLQQPQ
jgi:hypothetical protein